MRILSIEFTSNYIYLYEQNCKKSDITVEKKYKIEMPPGTYYNRMLINNDRRISDAIKNGEIKNGDMLEVDMDNGTIKDLENGKEFHGDAVSDLEKDIMSAGGLFQYLKSQVK